MLISVRRNLIFKAGMIEKKISSIKAQTKEICR